MIQASEISFVIQGPIEKNIISNVTNAIRKLFNGSKIIVSTWEGTSYFDFEYDDVILNVDPGGINDKNCPTFTNNLLRHLVSSQTGIARSNTKYTLRMRSDLILTSNNFLSFLTKFSKRSHKYQLFEQRIITTSFFSKKFLLYKNEVHPTPFHISDWIHFGLTSDIKKLYAAPLPEEPKQSHFFAYNPYIGTKTNLLGCSHQYAPEQYITYYAFSSKFCKKFSHYMDYYRDIIEISEKFVANNFIILNPSQFSFFCAKKNTGKDRYRLWTKYNFFMPVALKRGLYRYEEFIYDYKKYIDNNFYIPSISRIKRYINGY